MSKEMSFIILKCIAAQNVPSYKANKEKELLGCFYFSPSVSKSVSQSVSQSIALINNLLASDGIEVFI